MSIIKDIKNRMTARGRAEKEDTAVRKPEEEKKIVLEKGDLAAILIAGFFNFVLPIVLICADFFLVYLFLYVSDDSRYHPTLPQPHFFAKMSSEPFTKA